MTTQFDAIIIGSGQGGVPLAAKLAGRGREVALFERASMGGTCVNYGCIPSKAFLAAAHAAASGRYSHDLGIEIETSVDFPGVMARVRHIVSASSEGVEKRLEKAGVSLYRAEAAFVDERTVAGKGERATAPLIVVNTGKSPRVPGIPGLAGTPYLTYKDFWNLEALPASSIILGGGYVGVELGQGLARLGSETHIVERQDRIVSDEEEKMSEALMQSLQEDGVQFHLGCDVESVHYEGGHFSLATRSGEMIRGETLIVAAGRKPNTRALAVDKAGIDLDERGHIEVNDQFQSSNPYVYAIGDVTGQPAFTHTSWEDHRRLLAILDAEGRTSPGRSQRDRVLGYGFFTEPQVGRAGLTLAQAEAQGHRARAVTLPLEKVARASLTNHNIGFYRMVVDDETDRILGATLVGPQAAELVHVFIAHMECGSTWQTLEQSVHIHPTYAEGLPSLARLLQD